MKAEDSVMTILEQYKPQISAALPKHVTPDRMMRIIFSEIRKNPTLGKCQGASLVNCIIECSLLSLEPGGALGHAYFVPFFDNKKGVHICQLILGYKGMLELINRSGKVASVQSHVVYEDDVFEYEYGTNEYIKFIPALSGYKKSDADIKAVFSIATLANGHKVFKVMSKGQVDAIRARSKSSDRGPWVTDYAEMARKCPIRSSFKYLPSSIQMQRAIHLDEMADVGLQGEVIDHVVKAQTKDTEKQSKTEKIAQKLGANIEPKEDAAKQKESIPPAPPVDDEWTKEYDSAPKTYGAKK
jgi:recombination protein RecT